MSEEEKMLVASASSASSASLASLASSTFLKLEYSPKLWIDKSTYSHVIPYSLSFSFKPNKSMIQWLKKCSGFREILYDFEQQVIFQDQAFATKVYNSLIENGYDKNSLDLFPACMWPVHPMKSDFISKNLTETIQKLIKECYDGVEEQDIPFMFTHPLSLVINGISGKTEKLHSCAYSLYQKIDKFIFEISIRRIDLEMLKNKHRDVLLLKVKKFIKLRERKNRSFVVAGEGEQERNIHFSLSKSKKGDFIIVNLCGMMKEVNSIQSRINEMKDYFYPQFKRIEINGQSDWELLCRCSFFQKTNVKRIEIEERHSVLIKNINNKYLDIFIYALCAEDLVKGEMDFFDYLNTIRRLRRKKVIVIEEEITPGGDKENKENKDDQKHDEPGC